MENDSYQVLIVGAGISGIGASKCLTEQGIPHLLIESRDRIGGRITSQQFDGVKVELGASFVHSPKKEDNRIAKYLEGVSWGKLPGKFMSDTYYYENEGLMKNKHIEKAEELYEQMDEYIERTIQTIPEDKSVQEVTSDFYSRRVSRQNPQVKKIFESMRDYNSNVEGCQLSDLSIKQYYGDDTETKHDFLPEGGYSKVLGNIFSQCRANLKLGEKVLKIDYSGKLVRVITDKGTYRCRYVIGSFPLGVLQGKKVEFSPQMPEQYETKLQSIGNGVVNKIYVSFQKPFWGNRKGYINFVTKSQLNRYPVGFVMSEKNRHILCIFVSASQSVELSKWNDKDVKEDLQRFLRKFTFSKEETTIREFKMTRWHQEENSLGSYSFVKVGHDQEEASAVLRKPLGGKVWLVGEHMHPTANACAHAAFETGVWAAEEVSQVLDSSE